MRHLLKSAFLFVTCVPLFAAAPYEYFPVKTNMTTHMIVGINNRITGQLGGITTTNDGNGGMFLWDTNSTATVNATNIFDRSIPAPVNETFTAGAGTLATATYYYRVSALNALGETLASTETSYALTGPAGVNVNWAGVPGATGYKVYGRSTGAELLIATVGQIHTYLDGGSITPSGALPGADTTMGGSGRWSRILNPLQSSINLATQVTGVLTAPNGGTGASTLTGALQGNGTSAVTGVSGTQYGLLYWPTTATIGTTAAGTSTTLLHGAAGGVPTWGSVSLTADVSGDLPFANIAQIATGTLLGRNTAGTGDIEVITDIPTAITIGGAYIYRVGGTDVAVTDGGTGVSTLTSNGVMYGQGASALAVTTAGATNTVLTANGVSGAPLFSSAITVGTSVTSPAIVGSTSITDNGLTATRVTFAGTAGLLSDDADLTFATDTLTATKVIAPTSVTTPLVASSSGILTVTGTGGLTLTSGASNTLLTQNSVNVFTSEGSGAIVNTLYLKAGNVGIGTTTPGSKLEIGGTNPEIRFGPVSSGSGAYMSYNTSGDYFTINAVTQGVGYRNIGLATDGGKVGIGTTTPLAKLSINGGAHVGGDSDPGDNNLTVDGLTTTDTLTITTTSTHSYATASTVATFNASKQLVSSAVTTTELGYLTGVTSAVQTQLNARVREPKYGAGDPNFLGTSGDDDGQMFVNTDTGERWFYYQTGTTWLP